MSSTDLTNLASDLASNGFAGHDAAVRDVVRSARAYGIPSVLVDVLVDPREPEVARQRAFGMIASALAYGLVDEQPSARSAA
jgi:ABC-type sugar transport system substrate-binding protein